MKKLLLSIALVLGAGNIIINAASTTSKQPNRAGLPANLFEVDPNAKFDSGLYHQPTTQPAPKPAPVIGYSGIASPAYGK